ncbi:MAG: DUF2127 domain-containing protein, partial [Gammaproteobacteria bacterium]
NWSDKTLAQATKLISLHRLFLIGALIKGLDGLLEFIGGGLLLLVSRTDLSKIVLNLTAPELAEDPDDLVANFLRHVVHHLSLNIKYFASIYLLVHGAVKVSLMAGLLRGISWAYRPALFILTVFVLYQIYRFSHTHSLALLVFTVLDVMIIFLVFMEYRSRIGLRNFPGQ